MIATYEEYYAYLCHVRADAHEVQFNILRKAKLEKNIFCLPKFVVWAVDYQEVNDPVDTWHTANPSIPVIAVQANERIHPVIYGLWTFSDALSFDLAVGRNWLPEQILGWREAEQ